MALMNELFGRPIILPDGTVIDSSTLPEDWTYEAPEITTHSDTSETPNTLTDTLAIFLPGTSEEQEAMEGLVLNLLSSGDFLENFDPSQARDQIGRFASGAGGLASGVFHKAGHLEHSLKEYAKDKVSSSVARLPKWLQLPVMATFHVLRAGTAVAFATWTSGQALTERVAKEKGASPEQARRLRGILTSLDVTTFKPLSLALHVSGVHAATLGAVGLLPPASACYLAYSTARNPLATLRVARTLVRDVASRVVGKRSEITASIAHIDDELGFVYNALSDAEQMEMGRSLEQDLKDHGYSDWYIALLSAALDETGDAVRATQVANEAFDQQDEDPEPESQPDDAFHALGIHPPENTPTVHIDVENYDPNQPRDYRGQWASTRGGVAPPIVIKSKERFALSKEERALFSKLFRQRRALAEKVRAGDPSAKAQSDDLRGKLEALREMARQRLSGGDNDTKIIDKGRQGGGTTVDKGHALGDKITRERQGLIDKAHQASVKASGLSGSASTSDQHMNAKDAHLEAADAHKIVVQHIYGNKNPDASLASAHARLMQEHRDKASEHHNQATQEKLKERTDVGGHTEKLLRRAGDATIKAADASRAATTTEGHEKAAALHLEAHTYHMDYVNHLKQRGGSEMEIGPHEAIARSHANKAQEHADTARRMTTERGGRVDHAEEALKIGRNIRTAAGVGGIVHLGTLRSMSGHLSKDDFDKALEHGRKTGLITLSGAEGRHGVTRGDHEAGVHEEDPVTKEKKLLLFASVKKDPDEWAQGLGRGAEQKPKRTFTRKELNELIRSSWDKGDEKTKLTDLLAEHATPSGKVLEHGMSNSEDMHHVEVDGIKFHFANTIKGRKAAADSIHDAVGAGLNPNAIPEPLWRAQGEVIHTHQRNKDDPYWARRYSSRGFKSAATGGDGKTVVYNGKGAGQGTFAHEAGHNFATKIWNSTSPLLYHKEDAYAKAQKEEPPVTEYGGKSPAEDFAEAAKLYTVGRHRFKTKFPKKYAALEDLLIKHGHKVNDEGQSGEGGLEGARERVRQRLEDLVGSEATDNLDCGTGAGGFKYDNTCWRGGQGDSFAGHHEIPQHDESGRLYSGEELKKLFEDHAQHAGNLKVQTMGSSEPMKMVRFAGMEWRWGEGQLDRVVHDAARVHKVPKALLDAVGHVTYTGQRDTDEPEWKKKFNDDTFIIRAAGGHRSIISWNGYTMGSWTMAHEAGHNFAEKVWGDVKPPRDSAYGKAQRLEPPVSEYGASAPWEDFAEACKMYVKDKPGFKQQFPKKFAALDELIKTHEK